MLDWTKLPSPRTLRHIIKQLTPEQIKLLQPQISDVFAQRKRSQFKLIPWPETDETPRLGNGKIFRSRLPTL
jgi:hypothetical protein